MKVLLSLRTPEDPICSPTCPSHLTCPPAPPPPQPAGLSAELEEAAQLLSADPTASTLSMSVPPTTPAGGGDVKLDLSEDEQAQEESAEVSFLCRRRSLGRRRLTYLCSVSS